jgi:hypothetical protein
VEPGFHSEGVTAAGASAALRHRLIHSARATTRAARIPAAMGRTIFQRAPGRAVLRPGRPVGRGNFAPPLCGAIYPGGQTVLLFTDPQDPARRRTDRPAASIALLCPNRICKLETAFAPHTSCGVVRGMLARAAPSGATLLDRSRGAAAHAGKFNHGAPARRKRASVKFTKWNGEGGGRHFKSLILNEEGAPSPLVGFAVGERESVRPADGRVRGAAV